MMRKLSRRFLSLFLVLTLFIGMLPALAVGTNKSTAKTYKTYVALGDSIGSGFALDYTHSAIAAFANQTSLEFMNEPHSKKSYPNLLAGALKIKAEDFSDLTCPCMRAADLLDCLDDTFTADTTTYFFMKQALPELKKLGYQDKVKNADIITLDIGANDILMQPIISLMNYLDDVSLIDLDMLFAGTAADKEADTLPALMKRSQSLGLYTNVLQFFANEVEDNFNQWATYWDRIINRIYTLNPDVTLVVLGVYNPYENLTLSDENTLKFARILNGIVRRFNQYVQNTAHGEHIYIYTDISGIESIATAENRVLIDPDFLDKSLDDIHPSEKGQAEIAARIQKALVSGKYVTLSPFIKLLLRIALKYLS